MVEEELKDCEVFVTDNSTAEGAYCKGNSSSQSLFELVVVRLRNLGMNSRFILHVIHMSVKQMIAQGTDGLSRWDHLEGVMQGRSIIDFIPLHLSALDRSPGLWNWLFDSFGQTKPTFLDPKGWFSVGHTNGNFVWTPPPSAVDAVVEQVGKARYKRPG